MSTSVKLNCWRGVLLTFSLALLGNELQAANPAITLYIAPGGNDGWSGRLAEPNAERTDGPLASLAAARDAIRKAGTAESRGSAKVLARGGVYHLIEPFVLEPQDSGSADAPVVYESYQGERPVFSGGLVVQGLRQQGQFWETEIPEVREGRVYFRQLFVDGQRRQRARSPNEGYYRIADLMPGPMDPASKKAVLRDRFRFRPGDLQPFGNLGEVELTLMHSWETSIHPLKAVDLSSNVVQFAAPLKEWWGLGYWEKEQRYFIENAPELLDRAGEWHLDWKSGVLRYWPLPGERLGETEVVAPILGELVRFQGDSEAAEFVQHVRLRGLAFHHADWRLDPKGNSSTQAAVEVPAVITADGARNCTIERCEVAHIGTYGIWLRHGCKECRVQQNRLFDLGAGGIRVGEAIRSKTDAGESSGNVVDNNHIYDGGRVYPAGVGIWVAQSSHNRISHNDVHDLFYSGMSIGWNWDDSPNRTHDNVIEWNHVHDLGHGMLSDAGLIYCLGASPGSVIRNNVFHDMWPYSAPPFGWGIYFDATCSGYLCESNLVYNTRSGGVFWNNGGHEHVIRNNIFAPSADFAIWPFWEKRPNTFERNIVCLTQGALFVTHAEGTLRERRKAGEPLGTWDYNLYYDGRGSEALRFFNHSFAEWQALGLDAHSLLANPQFVQADRGDFRLKSGSPAFALGFQPFDNHEAGLYGDSEWTDQAEHQKCPFRSLPPTRR